MQFGTQSVTNITEYNKSVCIKHLIIYHGGRQVKVDLQLVWWWWCGSPKQVNPITGGVRNLDQEHSLYGCISNQMADVYKIVGSFVSNTQTKA